MNRKPDWYATRKISWHISVVYCRFLCELQSQALISPIQCCKQDGPPVLKEHCGVYALSSQTQTEFKQRCNHDHDERCEECKPVESTLAGIERLM